jgi:hypothetical protein
MGQLAIGLSVGPCSAMIDSEFRIVRKRGIKGNTFRRTRSSVWKSPLGPEQDLLLTNPISKKRKQGWWCRWIYGLKNKSDFESLCNRKHRKTLFGNAHFHGFTEPVRKRRTQRCQAAGVVTSRTTRQHDQESQKQSTAHPAHPRPQSNQLSESLRTPKYLAKANRKTATKLKRLLPQPNKSGTAQTHPPPKEGFSLKAERLVQPCPVETEAEPNLRSVKSSGVPACGVDDWRSKFWSSLRFHRRAEPMPSAYLL